ncbi:uncharacterized protein ASCRUDRAFT_9982 [Ascoidea rubescens DSM 1968]|uniref:ditrans,polycis-polyprenyl diphosphate synthase [(2E,6E)-farnesyldiphosphate specific] n=1 Tax=Ascoidea rubescens DSM 1968 TaxID=1344418 RepID=A0A1D2VAD9_9ASCO|nr:hypothetical protein ASCRUDRAFT_9982 [Ascoidea rubescens DSM 1968]ODV58628.1 hypothetical protein ASCRUDRAFT_9982 [Ascoidea rubescens DSM 1968]
MDESLYQVDNQVDNPVNNPVDDQINESQNESLKKTEIKQENYLGLYFNSILNQIYAVYTPEQIQASLYFVFFSLAFFFLNLYLFVKETLGIFIESFSHYLVATFNALNISLGFPSPFKVSSLLSIPKILSFLNPSNISSNFSKNSLNPFLTNLYSLHSNLVEAITSQFLATIVPLNYISVQKALLPTSDNSLPDHISIILSKNKRVASPPDNIQDPEMNSSGNWTIPETPENLKAVYSNYNHFVAESEFKASEKIRILTETATIASWCSALKIKTLSIYEQSGDAWENVDHVSNVIAADLKALYGKSKHPSVKIVNFNSGETYFILPDAGVTPAPTANYNRSTTKNENENKNGKENGKENKNENENENENEKEKENEKSNSPQISISDLIFTELTLILLSKKDGMEHFATFTRSLINQNISSEAKVDQLINSEINRYRNIKPDIILKPNPNRRNFPNSLLNFPLITDDTKTLFYARNENLTFNFFIRGIRYYLKANNDQE